MEMEQKRKVSVGKVLKKETDNFLKELNELMVKEGVEEILKKDIKNQDTKDKDTEDKRSKTLGTTQFKMLMDAAGKASCTDELLLFLSYQESKGHGWDKEISNKETGNKETVAEKVRKSIRRIRDRIYRSVEEAWEGDITEDEKRLVELEIVKKYTGYLFWKAAAIRKGK